MSSPTDEPVLVVGTPPPPKTVVIRPRRLFPDKMEAHERFIGIVKYSSLKNEESVPTAVLDAVKNMFVDFGITEWKDLVYFDQKDVTDYFASNSCKEITYRDRKAMGYLLQYSKTNTVVPDEPLNMLDVIKEVVNPGSLIHPPKPVVSPEQIQKTVPELDTFKGTDEDSFGWMEDTLTKLGTVGLARYLSNRTTVLSNLKIAESVFYALRQATMAGVAKHVSEDLIQKGNCNPVDLWNDIERYYDCNVNKANVILFEIKRLLAL